MYSSESIYITKEKEKWKKEKWILCTNAFSGAEKKDSWRDVLDVTTICDKRILKKNDFSISARKFFLTRHFAFVAEKEIQKEMNEDISGWLSQSQRKVD